jgi:hypothetical protein
MRKPFAAEGLYVKGKPPEFKLTQSSPKCQVLSLGKVASDTAQKIDEAGARTHVGLAAANLDS